MHKEQKLFCASVKTIHPEHFENVSVADFGSLDINGNNRYLFTDSNYIGIDIGEGKNVDIVSKAHEYKPPVLFDIVISTEMLEHDKHWENSIVNMYNCLKNGGMLLITCATIGRNKHGLSNFEPLSSPFTNDYYENISEEMLESVTKYLNFKESHMYVNEDSKDIYFWGIKQ